MRKNNKLINQMRIMAELNKADSINKAADMVVPILYAAVAIALHNVNNFEYEQINEVFAESQRIWAEFSGRPEDMIALCEEETGIVLKGEE